MIKTQILGYVCLTTIQKKKATETKILKTDAKGCR
jgi:hypothetical protein